MQHPVLDVWDQILTAFFPVNLVNMRNHLTVQYCTFPFAKEENNFKILYNTVSLVKYVVCIKYLEECLTHGRSHLHLSYCDICLS